MNRKFTQQWLETLCGLLPSVHSAVFMLPDRQKNLMRPVAKWPLKLEQFNDFASIVKYTLKKKKQAVIPNAESINDQSLDFYAWPIFAQSRLLGVIVIKIKHLPDNKQSAVFKIINQSVNWLKLGNAPDESENNDFYSHIVGVLAACFEQQSYHEGLIRLVTELTRLFKCERVAFSEYGKNHCQIVALSNSANFDQRSNLMQKIADAMDEAIEQDSVIIFPDPKSALIQRSHLELARKFGSGSLCSIPLVHAGEVFGAVTLLRSEEMPFDTESVSLNQQILALMTPLLVLKKEQEKNLLYKMGTGISKNLQTLFGIKFLKLKLASTVIALLLIFGMLSESEYRVTADAILEGKIQRVVSAPISGYLLSASVQAGDTVNKGDVMASLDDAELKLELAKHNGELKKARREYREAQSARDLVTVRVVSEQINQTNAQIELTEQQLQKIRLTAPFDGVIIEGDLTQMLGSPVERGDALFKIAPLDGYRIILKVKESQIAYVEPKQTGTLALSSLSQNTFPLTVEKITAVAKADDGANIFRVEASMDNPPDLLRPGMQGVGKINAGQARLIWIWTHEITDWLRLWLWSWWP